MKITSSAVSLNVADVDSSAAFLQDHFGFHTEMAESGFVSLAREDTGFNVIFLQVGLPTFQPASHAGAAGPGLLLVLRVDDIEQEWQRLRNEVRIVTPIQTEPWGERFFQVLDPNGIVIQLVQWVDQS